MNSHSFGSHKWKGEALNLENSFIVFLVLNTLRKNMPVKFWDYEQTFLQFMMQKPLIKKSLVTFGQKNHNTIKSKLEKGKKKAYLCTMYCPQEHCLTALRPNSRRSQTV